jgi:glycosyltransferase involved in cell wall biosynthesis
VRRTNVIVTTEHHFDRTPDAQVWTDGQLPYAFWTRYLSAFDSVRVVARVRDITVLPHGFRPASGAGVTFFGVPDYRGPEQYLLRAMSIESAIAKSVQNSDAVILRVPGQIGACVERHMRKQGRPYGVEVVGDPYDTFAPKAVRHPLRPLFRWFFPRRLRRVCGRACAAAYVTKHALQRRYPPAPQAFATYYSSVELPLAAFAKVPRAPKPVDSARLIFVGTMARLYKGPDVLLDAVGHCVRHGQKIELVLVGSGQFQRELQSRALALGLGDRTQFRGHLTTPEAVRAELDQAHLFVLPSRQEGLPRAMIEAMARALPCLGSGVGGIPELLLAEDLVPPDDALALANKICEVLADPARMARMSARNLEQAAEYSEAPAQRRQAFYCNVKAQTQAWHQASESLDYRCFRRRERPKC